MDSGTQVPAHDPGGPFTVATVPARLLPALVAEEDLEHEGVVYSCGMQPGLADFPEWGIRGYLWPYMRFGQSDGEPSTLWFVLRGYTGSFEKAEYMDDFLRGHRAATWRLVRDDLNEGSQLIHEEKVCAFMNNSRDCRRRRRSRSRSDPDKVCYAAISQRGRYRIY